jgi:hypothetical protein
MFEDLYTDTARRLRETVLLQMALQPKGKIIAAAESLPGFGDTMIVRLKQATFGTWVITITPKKMYSGEPTALILTFKGGLRSAVHKLLHDGPSEAALCQKMQEMTKRWQEIEAENPRLERRRMAGKPAL